MAWFLAALLQVVVDPQPADFEFTALRGDAERPFLVGRLPFNLRIRALDDSGKPLTSFNGMAEITGLSCLDAERNEIAVTSTGHFKDGSITLEGVRLTGDAVTLRAGSHTATWTPPRVVPGWLSIVPPLLAVALAVAFRQVLVALLAGVWMGAVFIYNYNPFAALLRTFDTHILGSVADEGHVAILLFTLALGGMVGVISRSGGTAALVRSISRFARTRRSGMIATWLMGIAVFFDDYANCLLVGNTVRPFTDSKRISREKLAFLVDATAAPVAGMALISTWIGYEIGLLADTAEIGDQAYSTFVYTIPYRFYSLLMLFFVFLIALTRRDFGPMLRAEKRAVETGQLVREGATPLVDRDLTEMKPPEGRRLTLWNAVLPIVSVISIVIIGLYASGRAAAPEGSSLRVIIENADPFAVLLWAAFGGSFAAIFMALATRVLRFSETLEAWVAGVKSMVMALLILTLAWSLGGICKGDYLQTGDWVISLVNPPAALLPMITFLAACLIAFATGTSWGTMAIIIPIAVPLAWAQTPEESIRLATVGAVLTGAVFGDHCSPISDTTVMSSVAAASDHLDHVRTQAPYALLCAGVASVVGFLPAGLGVPPWISLPVGAAILVAFLRFFGRSCDIKES